MNIVRSTGVKSCYLAEIEFIMIADAGRNIYVDKANLSNHEDLNSM